ncbi:hypothetical protein PEBR_26107 [Penicillium brasilianum]|uniref:Uncharacterized protein n=1 Tax=Penicillium brasilianum TaxID=104259 RepID=A0A1S9RIQ2_PENBI|nr:hypothetical protein PEBR_26107 [Penicillium brasilianum]
MAALVEACIARPRLLAPMCRIKQRSGDSSIYKPGQANALRSLALPRAVGSDSPARGQTIGSRSPGPACQLAPEIYWSKLECILMPLKSYPRQWRDQAFDASCKDYSQCPDMPCCLLEGGSFLAGAWHTVRLQIDFGPVANDEGTVDHYYIFDYSQELAASWRESAVISARQADRIVLTEVTKAIPTDEPRGENTTTQWLPRNRTIFDHRTASIRFYHEIRMVARLARALQYKYPSWKAAPVSRRTWIRLDHDPRCCLADWEHSLRSGSGSEDARRCPMVEWLDYDTVFVFLWESYGVGREI